MFYEWFEAIENLFIYRPRNGVIFEIIHGSNKCPSRLAKWLGTCNNQLLMSKLYVLIDNSYHS